MKHGSLSIIGAMIGCLGLIFSSMCLIDVISPFSPVIAFIFRLTYVISLGVLFYLSIRLMILNWATEGKK